MSSDPIRRSLGILIVVALAVESSAHIGSCEDHSFECFKWRGWGLCDSNLRFMALNCPVTCNVCLDPGCFDRSQECAEWVQLGLCGRNRQVQRTCPHSCDLCQIPEFFTKTQSIAEPDFDCGRPVTQAGGRGRRQIIFPDELDDYLRSRPNNPQDPFVPHGPEGHHHHDEEDHHDPHNDPHGTIDRHRPQPLKKDPVASIDVTDTFCGATLIHERFLLTAAHCVLDPDKPVRTVRLGELDFSKENEAFSAPVDYSVKLITVHPEYKTNSLERYNDIALIETTENVQFNDVVYPFCLPKARPANGATVTGSGFGLVNNTDRSTHVQEADLMVVDSHMCWNMYEREGLGNTIRTQYPHLFQGTDILCATFPGRDACQGDSGGPLFQDVVGQRFLVGVIGQGISCRGNGVPSLPGFYISVADHIDFINSVIYPS
ncbi:coagulation factor IX-like [Macrobrachium rosenbergii]|uniref:coagulation factor IX-like n=1 Tax=Macrobrachium rosenbergii TaxID=79674 RepID=UPI0034D3C65A